MATYDDYMRAAAKAQKANDATARDAFLAMASKLRGQGSVTPGFEDVPGPMPPPRADAPGAVSAPEKDTFGGTIGKMVQEPAAATAEFARRTVNPQPALPTMQNKVLSSVGNAAMTGLSALNTGMSAVAGLAGEIFGGSPTGERQLARDIMGGMQVAMPELAGAGATVRTAQKVGKLAEKPISEAARAAQAAEDLNIVPSLGMTGKTGAVAASGLEKTIFTGNRVTQDALRATEEIERAASMLTAKVGDVQTPFGAGDTLQRGLQKYVDVVQKRSEQMYADVGKFIPADTPMTLDKTQSAVAAFKSGFEGTPELAKKLGLNEWDKVMSEIADNGATWEAVRKFRSDVGRAIGSTKGALGDEDAARLKSLYASLTEDMETAAKAAGPEAYGRWKAANGFYKRSAKRVEEQIDGLIKKGKAPEAAFEAFYAATLGNRSSSDLTRIRALKGSMEAEDWNTVSASIVDRLGKATPGAQGAAGDKFSPATFLTNWNKLSPEGKKLLLPAEAREEFEKLALVVDRAKAAGLERNTSNTGNAISILASGYGISAAPLTTAIATGGLYLSSRALTNTWFLRNLNAAIAGKTKPLEVMANGSGPFKADAAEVLRLMAANSVNAPSEEPQRAVAP